MFRVQPNQCCHDDCGEDTEGLFYLVSLRGHPVFPLIPPPPHISSSHQPCPALFYNTDVIVLQFLDSVGLAHPDKSRCFFFLFFHSNLAIFPQTFNLVPAEKM